MHFPGRTIAAEPFASIYMSIRSWGVVWTVNFCQNAREFRLNNSGLFLFPITAFPRMV